MVRKPHPNSKKREYSLAINTGVKQFSVVTIHITIFKNYLFFFFSMDSNFLVSCVLASIIQQLRLPPISHSYCSKSNCLLSLFTLWGLSAPRAVFNSANLPTEGCNCSVVIVCYCLLLVLGKLSGRGEMTAYLARAFRMTVFLKSK